MVYDAGGILVKTEICKKKKKDRKVLPSQGLRDV